MAGAAANCITNLPGDHALETAATRLDLADAEVSYLPGALAPDAADECFLQLRREIDWRQEEIVLFGVRRLVPRLVAWHGDADAVYRYSGVEHQPLPWTAELLGLKHVAETHSAQRFNSVLLNLYRDGRDGMGWHADDEPELGVNPAIASLSLGATRRFRMRHRRHRDRTLAIDLEHGSLLVMQGATQHHWLHALPKTTRPTAERINLTFRSVRPAGT